MAAPEFSAASTTVHLTGPQETLLITLYAKWVDYYSDNCILGDRWAVEVLESIDGQLDDLKKRLKTPTYTASVTLRALCLDTWASQFLAENDCVTVLHLACGLDTRALRLRDKCYNKQVRWIDVDMPDVIDIRRRLKAFVPAPAPGYSYELIGSSVTETAWLQQIPADRPTMVIFEGLTMYLEPADGASLLQRLTTHFQSGQLIFDCCSPATKFLMNLVVWFRSDWSFKFNWTMNNPKSVEKLCPGLVLKDQVPMTTAPGINRMSLQGQWVLWIMSWIPILRSPFSYLRCTF